MRWLTLLLVALIAILQYPLWLGKGGWLKVWDYNRLLAEQQAVNRQLEARNAGLDAEVRDLKQGYEAIEERARFELGMIKEGEVFVQLPDRRPPGEGSTQSPPRNPRPTPIPAGGRPSAGRLTSASGAPAASVPPAKATPPAQSAR